MRTVLSLVGKYLERIQKTTHPTIYKKGRNAGWSSFLPSMNLKTKKERKRAQPTSVMTGNPTHPLSAAACKISRGLKLRVLFHICPLKLQNITNARGDTEEHDVGLWFPPRTQSSQQWLDWNFSRTWRQTVATWRFPVTHVNSCSFN